MAYYFLAHCLLICLLQDLVCSLKVVVSISSSSNFDLRLLTIHLFQQEEVLPFWLQKYSEFHTEDKRLLVIDATYAYFNKIVLKKRHDDRNTVALTITIYDESSILFSPKLINLIDSLEIYLDYPCKESFKMVDAFSYNGEIVAPFRMKYLYDYFDEFLILESRYTFSGQLKSDLYFKSTENHLKFAPYLSKIKYIVLEHFPDMPSNWNQHKPAFIQDISKESFWREEYQMKFFKFFIPINSSYVYTITGTENDGATTDQRIASSCKTVLYLSDVDEIPNRDILAYIRQNHQNSEVYQALLQPIHIEMYCFYYNFHWMSFKRWYKPYIIDSTGLFDITSMSHARLNQVTFMKWPTIGGWHLSYFLSIDDIIRKIESFSHREFDLTQFKLPAKIHQSIATGQDLFGRTDERWNYVALNISSLVAGKPVNGEDNDDEYDGEDDDGISSSEEDIGTDDDVVVVLPDGWEELQILVSDLQDQHNT